MSPNNHSVLAHSPLRQSTTIKVETNEYSSESDFSDGIEKQQNKEPEQENIPINEVEPEEEFIEYNDAEEEDDDDDEDDEDDEDKNADAGIINLDYVNIIIFFNLTCIIIIIIYLFIYLFIYLLH